MSQEFHNTALTGSSKTQRSKQQEHKKYNVKNILKNKTKISFERERLCKLKKMKFYHGSGGGSDLSKRIHFKVLHHIFNA